MAKHSNTQASPPAAGRTRIRASRNNSSAAPRRTRPSADGQTSASRLQTARDAPKRAHALLASLYASAPVLIGVKDRESRLVTVNPAVLDMIGRPEQDVIGRNDINLFGGTLSNRAREEDRTVIDTGRTVMTEQRTGERTWEVVKSPWRDASGTTRGVVVVLHDVTARKELERHLLQSTRSLEWRVKERTRELLDERGFIETVLDTAPALVIVLDREGRILRFNRACEQVSGRRFAEVEGLSFFELVLPAEEVAGVREVFLRLRRGDFPNRHENRWRHVDGSERIIAWSNSCIIDARGEVRYVMGTGIDVTEQRRAEHDARERLSELAQLHRLHAMGELAGLLAHQLNQPLTAIATYAEASLATLKRGPMDPAMVGDNLERIFEQAMRAARSISELRAYLARGGEVRESIDLAELARGACHLLEPGARSAGIRIDLHAAGGLAPVNVRTVQIEQVFANLVQNSIESMRNAGLSGGSIRLTITAEGTHAQVSVHDDGPGFNAAAMARLFEPTYTTKPGGIGMGLPICRSIVDSHGGRIWALPGRGGGIHFTLPLSP